MFVLTRLFHIRVRPNTISSTANAKDLNHRKLDLLLQRSVLQHALTIPYPLTRASAGMQTLSHPRVVVARFPSIQLCDTWMPSQVRWWLTWEILNKNYTVAEKIMINRVLMWNGQIKKQKPINFIPSRSSAGANSFIRLNRLQLIVFRRSVQFSLYNQ